MLFRNVTELSRVIQEREREKKMKQINYAILQQNTLAIVTTVTFI